MMDTTTTIAIFTPVMPVVVSLLKTMFPNADPRYFSVGFSVFIAGLLGALKFLYGDEVASAILAQMGAVITFVFGVGTGLYQVQK